MRLLTHNLLACHARACQSTSNNFPLLLKDVQLELIEAEPNPVFLQGFLPKLDWKALVSTARSLGDTSLPDQAPDVTQPLQDQELLQKLHRVLLEVSRYLFPPSHAIILAARLTNLIISRRYLQSDDRSMLSRAK